MTPKTFTSTVFESNTSNTAQDLRELIGALTRKHNELYSGCGEDECQHGTYCDECRSQMNEVENERSAAQGLLPDWEELEDHFSVDGLEALLSATKIDLNLLTAYYDEFADVTDYNEWNDTEYTLEELKEKTQVIEFDGGIVVKSI